MKEYKRAIVFTRKPLTEMFKYKDIFQIYPALLESQPSSVYQKHFANILEYWIDDTEIIDVGKEYEET